MLDYLPRYYQDARIPQNIVNLEAEEVQQLNDAVQDVLDQFFVSTATWGLEHWERICDIPTDNFKPVQERRSVIESKLRGVGTVNADLIKTVAKAYVNGEVEITENQKLYQINITFVGQRGVPSNLADIQNAINEIVPAHLQTTFTFTYLPWSELEGYKTTYNDIKAYQWGELQTMFLNDSNST
ncbi:YmfQ family protein [Longirhabdus pacifica]|uniref:YmfQ family protein n=1 Tax=Longirhabdus pacifica TaxID=2305227 RepID=UPI0023EA524D|nr:YmfQ family protein [Longirhabdus pacifica]